MARASVCLNCLARSVRARIRPRKVSTLFRSPGASLANSRPPSTTSSRESVARTTLSSIESIGLPESSSKVTCSKPNSLDGDTEVITTGQLGWVRIVKTMCCAWAITQLDTNARIAPSERRMASPSLADYIIGSSARLRISENPLEDIRDLKHGPVGEPFGGRPKADISRRLQEFIHRSGNTAEIG